MRFINQSNLFTNEEIDTFRSLLPLDYQQLDINILFLDYSKQLFQVQSIFAIDTWQKFLEFHLKKNTRGYYETKNKQITMFTRFNTTYKTIYTKQMIKYFRKKKNKYQKHYQSIEQIIRDSTKPRILFFLLHEIQHAYQHLFQDKPFDVTSDYLEQWQETDADVFAQNFYNEHAETFQRLFKLPHTYRFDVDRKKGFIHIIQYRDGQKFQTFTIYLE